MFILLVFKISKPFVLSSVALGWLKSKWNCINKSSLASTGHFTKATCTCSATTTDKNKQLFLMLK